MGNTETPTNPCDSSTISQDGRQRSTTMPDPTTGDAAGISTETYYDEAGRSTAVVQTPTGSSSAVTSCATYDARGRLVSQSTDDPNGTGGALSTAWTYSDDGLTVTTAATFATTPSCGGGGSTCSASVTLDLLGRPVASTDVWGAVTSTDYSLDPSEDGFSSTTTSTVTIGGYTTTTVSEANRDGSTASVTRTDTSSATTTLGATMTYDAAQLDTVTYTKDGSELVTLTAGYSSGGGGLTSSATWSQSGTTIVDDSLTLSTNSARTLGETITVGGVTYDQDYTFDEAGWLTGATLTSSDSSVTGSWSQTFEAGSGTNPNAHLNGNASSRTTTLSTPSETVDETTTWGYDFADRLESTSDSSVGTIEHDDFGNLTTYGDLTFSYDQLGRTLGAADADDSVAYERFTDGSLLAKTTDLGGASTTVRYGPGGLILDETSTPYLQVLPLGPLVAVIDVAAGTSTSFEITSLQNGNALLSLDVDGTPASTPSLFDPFGGSVLDPATFDPSVPSYRWQATTLNETQTVDEASDLGYVMMGARPYLDDVGRFAAPDPKGGSSLNQYAYAGNDPINSSDPSGEATTSATPTFEVDIATELVGGFGGLAIGAAVVSYAYSTIAAKPITSFSYSLADAAMTSGFITMIGAVAIAAGVGMLLAYGFSKLLHAPVSATSLAIGAAVGEVGAMLGFWFRIGLKFTDYSRYTPRIVTISRDSYDVGVDGPRAGSIDSDLLSDFSEVSEADLSELGDLAATVATGASTDVADAVAAGAVAAASDL